MNKHTEHDLQVACVRWFRLQYSRCGRLLFAIPNGGQRNLVVAAKLKAEGVVSGVPDMFLALPNGGYHGLWIELKNGRAGRLSEHQKEMIDSLRAMGYCCVVCRTIDEFMGAVKEYMGESA